MLGHCLRVCCLWAWFIASISFKALALNPNPSIFYPLPTQSQGKFLAAKNLHLSTNGGIWVQDVHNNVLFYDGRHLLPRKGSLLDSVNDQLAYLEDGFWSFIDNEVYLSYPAQNKELVFSLEPGSEIRRIGASEHYIWVSDDSNFYSYNTQTSEIETYSLLELYKHNQSSYVYINDAQRVLSKWVLATTSGSYLSDGKRFSHIANSKKNFAEKIYFSSSRRELLIGTLRGAILVDIHNPSKLGAFIGDSHVLSFAETNQEYWVGTEHGLFTYSFMTGDITKVDSNSQDSFSLLGDKIYSLLNDESGGMWIATDRGVRYYSLYSHKFSRTSGEKLLSISRLSSIVKIIGAEHSGSLVATTIGLYHSESGEAPTLLYRGKINDMVRKDSKLWLATDEGLLLFDTDSETVTKQRLPSYLQQSPIEALALSDDRLWLSSTALLASFNLKTNQYHNLGKNWIVDSFLPARVTRLFPTKSSDLIIGTDHGIYTYSGQKIRFNRASEKYGQAIDISQDTDGSYWVVSSYGAFKLDNNYQNPSPVTLFEENTSPQCLMSSAKGMWMSGSKGVTYYSNDGRLLKHYGPPSGLITNEFLPNVCAIDSTHLEGDAQLLIGSKYGLVQAKESELLVANTPKNSIIFSQVSVDHAPISVGGNIKNGEHFPYGSSLNFLIGILPDASTLLLEYRLSTEDEWVAFEGGLLTLDHLLPGEYQLQVRHATSPIADEQSLTTLSFYIEKPWYLTSLAIFCAIVVFILLIVMIIFWRSYFMIKVNRNLKATIALKTDQLRHQSRVLLASNQQLRKQQQVRNILVERVAVLARSNAVEVNQALLSSSNETAVRQGNEVIYQLNILINGKHNLDGEKQAHNILLILNAVVEVWSEEFLNSGVKISVENTSFNQYIEVDYFNLDVLFNTLFSSALKRCYRGQELTIQLTEADGRLMIIMTDFGAPLPALKQERQGEQVANQAMFDFSMEHLPNSVSVSGGELYVYSLDSRNRLEISWPIIELERQEIPEKAISLNVAPSVSKPSITREEAWINTVQRLVSDNYTSPEFGTATAAKMLYVSERSLQRRFKSALDRTFKDYLNEYRLERACESLLAGEKIADVAFECGFNDPSYFSMRFKHHFGLPPSKFVENHIIE